MGYYRRYRRPRYRRRSYYKNNSSDFEVLVVLLAKLIMWTAEGIISITVFLFKQGHKIGESYELKKFSQTNSQKNILPGTANDVVPIKSQASVDVQIVPIVQVKNEKYELKSSLLTETEKKFLQTLKDVVGDKYIIDSQVQLSAIVSPKTSDYADFNRIKAKSVDFVLFDKNYTPVLAIELDDYTHNQWKRIQRDRFVDGVIEGVGLRMLHVEVGSKYDVEKLASDIFTLEATFG